MYRSIAFICALAVATSALAAPFNGLRLGMSEAEARAILGSDLQRGEIDGGFVLVTPEKAGILLGADFCTRAGTPIVNLIAERLGPSLTAFTQAVAEETASRGQPQWKVTTPKTPGGLQASIEATWQAPEETLMLSLHQYETSVSTYRTLFRAC